MGMLKNLKLRHRAYVCAYNSFRFAARLRGDLSEFAPSIAETLERSANITTAALPVQSSVSAFFMTYSPFSGASSSISESNAFRSRVSSLQCGRQSLV